MLPEGPGRGAWKRRWAWVASPRGTGSGKILEGVFGGGVSEQTTEASSCAGWPHGGCVLATFPAGDPGGSRPFSLSSQGSVHLSHR